MKITKKKIRQIKWGNHATLMECLDFLLDSYNEEKWDSGYKSCLQDMAVRSQRLAEYITKMATEGGVIAKRGKEEYFTIDVDELTKVIEDYFESVLNK
jgi:hypothetical protein